MLWLLYVTGISIHTTTNQPYSACLVDANDLQVSLILTLDSCVLALHQVGFLCPQNVI